MAPRNKFEVYKEIMTSLYEQMGPSACIFFPESIEVSQDSPDSFERFFANFLNSVQDTIYKNENSTIRNTRLQEHFKKIVIDNTRLSELLTAAKTTEKETMSREALLKDELKKSNDQLKFVQKEYVKLMKKFEQKDSTKSSKASTQTKVNHCIDCKKSFSTRGNYLRHNRMYH